ncbi:MAG: DsbA family protein [Rickettsiales bacterium]|jgi:protein-disulfide isomerase|nr:DsbA family protein [Rickettsiales bacterium]
MVMTILMFVLAIALVAATVYYNKKYGSSRSVVKGIVVPAGLLFASMVAVAHAVSSYGVRLALLGDPMMMDDAQQAVEAERERLARIESAKLIKQIGEEDVKYAPILGNPNGKVVMYEFFDYNCGHCKNATAAVSIAVSNNPELKVVLKNFVLWPQVSLTPAKAVIAAQRLDPANVAAFHEAMMAGNLVPKVGENEKITEKELDAKIQATVLNLAKKAGYDIVKLKKEMSDPEIDEEVRRTRDLAIKLGLRGTPAFIIGDRLMPYAPQPQELNEAVREAAAIK